MSEPPRAPKQEHCTHYIRMWGIPYKILDRAGYNLALPTAAGDPIFLNDENINVIHDWLQRDSDNEDNDEDDGDNVDFDEDDYIIDDFI